MCLLPGGGRAAGRPGGRLTPRPHSGDGDGDGAAREATARGRKGEGEHGSIRHLPGGRRKPAAGTRQKFPLRREKPWERRSRLCLCGQRRNETVWRLTDAGQWQTGCRPGLVASDRRAPNGADPPCFPRCPVRAPDAPQPQPLFFSLHLARPPLPTPCHHPLPETPPQQGQF